jgi:hypothetical protein
MYSAAYYVIIQCTPLSHVVLNTMYSRGGTIFPSFSPSSSCSNRELRPKTVSLNVVWCLIACSGCVIRETQRCQELLAGGMHDFFAGRPGVGQGTTRSRHFESPTTFNVGHITSFTCLHVYHLFGACTRAHAEDVLYGGKYYSLGTKFGRCSANFPEFH